MMTEIERQMSLDEAQSLDARAAEHARRAGEHVIAWYEAVSQLNDRRNGYSLLGYAAWEDYLHRRWDMTPGRWSQVGSFVEFVKAIADAAGLETFTNVNLLNEGNTRPIRPQLPAITNAIREKVDSGIEPETAIRDTVREYQRLPTAKQADELSTDYGLSVAGSDGYYHGDSQPISGPEFRPIWNALKALADACSYEQFNRAMPPVLRNQVLTDAKSAAEWLNGYLAAQGEQ